METETIKEYTYEQLSETAKQRALERYCENLEYWGLEDYLHERLKEMLDEKKIECIGKLDLGYSLNCCQGDGVCFMGVFEWDKRTIRITKATHHYSHSNTTNLDMDELEDDSKIFGDDCAPYQLQYRAGADEDKLADFESMYHEICGQLEKLGYDYIDYEQSEDNFIDLCKCNEYKFDEEGDLI